ncbi:MAG: hypothetical protein AB1671_05375 [Thermodesulfobacteriota bacterium]|jgi:hypothetical protein
MIEFAHTFLLVFGQLAVGGVVALSVPGFHEIERGFFKSTACVYLGCGLAIFLGKLYLVFFARPEAAAGMRSLEVAAWLAFCVCCGLYTYTLWGDPFVLRARAYLLTLLSGIVALTISASTYRHTPFFSIETLLYPLSFFTSALMLGAVATGMSLGHWYLIELGLSLDPFRRVFKFYAGTLIVHLGVLLVGTGLLLIAGRGETVASLNSLWTNHRALLWLRLGLGPLASLPLAYMIWRTLQIPQTMAATGLFYIAILAAVVGEFLGRFILFRTALPL